MKKKKEKKEPLLANQYNENTYKYNQYHKMHKNTQITDNMHFRPR